jgi:hypothetical protein
VDQELFEYLNRRLTQLRDEIRAEIAAAAAQARLYVDFTATETRRHFDVVAERLDRRPVDQPPSEDSNGSVDDSRTAIEDAKWRARIQEIEERSKPGRLLRYLEARATEIADRGGLGRGQSVVYAVPRLDRDEAAR